MERKSWQACVDRATVKLSRICEDAAEELSQSEERSLKSVRELTGALKDLATLRRSLTDEKKTKTVSKLEVYFDGSAEQWSK